MRRARGVAFIMLSTVAFEAVAQTSTDSEPTISGAVTGYYYAITHEADYGVGVASVNRGPLHLEARYNYEASRSASLYAGWNFAGGEGVTFQVTPILGGLFGETHGVVPGVEAGIAYRDVDAYIEAEYVRNLTHSDASYYYAWSEVGWKPLRWLRVGLVGQRTREVENGRDLQRGAFVQLIFDKLTLALYGFNPDSSSRYLIVSLGVQF